MAYEEVPTVPVFGRPLLLCHLHRKWPSCVHNSAACTNSPESVATILAICARSLLSSSCRAVVRFRAVTPGFLRPSILFPSRRKLGTEEFLWSTRSGVGLHSCFRGRESLLRTYERVVSKRSHSTSCKGCLWQTWHHSRSFVVSYLLTALWHMSLPHLPQSRLCQPR